MSRELYKKESGCIFIMINETLVKSDSNRTLYFDDALEEMKREVNGVLSTSPFIIRKYTKHLSKTTGKYIRAISLLVCAQNREGLIQENAVKLAAAVEILHLATLVHDDVIDNADIRRGEVSLQKKYGKRTAVICGDYLMCSALNLAGSISREQDYSEYAELELPDYMSRICLGELNQHINNGNLDLSVYQYLKIIYGKTAALFEASFYGGAILSEKEPSTQKKYARLGRFVGMIFQLTDDCMDFETTESVAKKPVQSDYEQNVITLPLIYAFRNKNDFKEKAKTTGITREEINDTVRITGGLNYARTVAKKYYKKSLTIINELDINEDKREKLTTILENAYRTF
jgi:heptaprenyl diphosphate synthase